MSEKTISVTASSAAPNGHLRAGIRWLPTPQTHEVTLRQLEQLQADPRIKIQTGESEGPSPEELQAALLEKEAGLQKWEAELSTREDAALRKESELKAQEATLKVAQQALETAQKQLAKDQKKLEEAQKKLEQKPQEPPST